MTPTNPRMRELARRIIVHDLDAPRPGKSARGKKSAENKSTESTSSLKPAANNSTELAADLEAIEKLRPLLVTLMGKLGFQALLQRASALAAAEEPHPKKTRVLTSLLTLLEAFIGEVLILQVVREVWPKVPLDELDSGKGETREEEK